MVHCLFRKKLEKGSIMVLGGKPGDRTLGLPGALVGFLPQTTRWGCSNTRSFFPQPFYGVHCVWDIFLLRTAPSSHPKESHDAEVFFFLLAFNINGTIAPWSKSKKIRTNISRLELLQLLELPLEDREVSSNETIPMMMMMVQPQNGGYCDNDDNGDCFF